MLPKTESASFLIADISGYTSFLAGVELDHAHDIIADVMDTVVRCLRPPFRLAKFEGDAAFFYAVNDKIEGIMVFAGIEVDILADGTLDLADSVLEQMDIVIASVHSHFNQSSAEMTDRLLKAVENPNTSLIGHPTGRLLLRRDAYSFDIDAVVKSAAQRRVAMELNSYPDRLDLCDRHLRLAKQHTDSHHTSHLDKIRFGILQARRAWLTKEDVLNTLPVQKFAKAMKHAWS